MTDRMVLETLIRIGGLFPFGFLIAGMMMTRVVDWKGQLTRLDPFLRQLVWVYFGFIGLILVGMGALALAFPDVLAGGTSLGRSLSGFIAVFWTARLLLALFVLDTRPYCTHWFLTAGERGLTVAFAYLAAVFAWAAIAPGAGG